MMSCVDTVMRMIIRNKAEAARLFVTVRHDSDIPPCDLTFPLKDVAATSISQKCVHFKCPLSPQLCTNLHVAVIPERKHDSAPAKVEHFIDMTVIVGCLEMALHRGAWDEMFNFVCTGKFRGLRIILTTDTIADYEDDNCVNVDQKAKVLTDKDQLALKMPALVRHAVERYRSQAAEDAHIALAVTGQMFRYQRFLDQSNPYAHTYPK